MSRTPDRVLSPKDEKPSASTGERSTPDLNFSAYLSEIGRPLLRLEGPPGRRVFVFGNVTDADVAAFYSGAKVSAIGVLGRLRDLKGLLMNPDGGGWR